MQIEANKAVSLNYTLRNGEGEILDESTPDAPLTYLHGHQNIIPGLEAALAGKSLGDDIDVTIPPAEAYGEYDESLIQQVPRTLFQGVDQIEPGMQFQAEADQGMHVVTVKEVNDDSVTIDANHELAGETLSFSVSVTEVRDATQDELDHGHAHGPGGHDH